MKPRKKLKKPAVKTTRKKAAPKKKTSTRKKQNTKGMNVFQQCMVLAAMIHQERNKDKKFLFTPLPDVNSTALLPLRDLLNQYEFTRKAIAKAAHDVIHSKTFKECFGLRAAVSEAPIRLKSETENELVQELLQLAGPEAKKMIYLGAEENPRDIQKTTLEKHALKLGLIEHIIHTEPFQREDHHKKIIIRLNLQSPGQRFQDQRSRLLGKQHRGRG